MSRLLSLLPAPPKLRRLLAVRLPRQFSVGAANLGGPKRAAGTFFTIAEGGDPPPSVSFFLK